MPTPVIQDESIGELIAGAVDLQRAGRTDITFTMVSPPAPIMIPCDSRQLRQALTNLLQNAVDAIEGRRSEEHTSELQSLMRISYAVFCLQKKKKHKYRE